MKVQLSSERLISTRADAYRTALTALTQARAPYAVGGAFALARHTGMHRDTKDLDLFVRKQDVDATLETLSNADFDTEITFDYWLAKARRPGVLIDIIFGSANGVCPVDDEFFRRTFGGPLFDVPVRYACPEDMIWSKAFVMSRGRFDGADITHLILKTGEDMDWRYLFERFGDHWQVLLAHLTLFDFSFPSERHKIPDEVRRELLHRSEAMLHCPSPTLRLCRGTLLSRRSYLQDLDRGGYLDARVSPFGDLTPEQVQRWTDHED